MNKKTIPAKEIKHTRVEVNSWQNLRLVEIQPDQVGLQVTVPKCSHCPTCQGRVKEFTGTLSRQPGVMFQWRYLNDGAAWLFLPVTQEENPLQVLRDRLGVKIVKV